MSLVIDLTPSEEARVSAAAKQTGLAPSEWVKRLVEANLPADPVIGQDPGSPLCHQHERDGAALAPDVYTTALFAQWAEEDARLTQEERKANEFIYAEIEKNGIPRTEI